MHRSSSSLTVARSTAGATLLIAALVLAGCSADGEQGGPAASTTASATGAPTATPSIPDGPVLLPDGSAEDNLPYFTQVVANVWSTPENAQGRAYIDALADAGFDRTAMQVTLDQSTVGNPAESIQFSVLWGDECLIGQVGPATGAPVTVTAGALEGGLCLIGKTRPIDW